MFSVSTGDFVEPQAHPTCSEIPLRVPDVSALGTIGHVLRHHALTPDDSDINQYA